jgi:23S rRNA (cytidine1920-2'-O)/16S rRNA (cytidine1409-2'-O)-methyltransferase
MLLYFGSITMMHHQNECLCDVAHINAGIARRTRIRAVAKQRLDVLLAQRGLFASRSRAAASVMAGEVAVGPERRRAAKPGEMVAEDVLLDVRQAPSFVSRGGVKLDNALTASGLDVAGRRALDVGSSTGGFSDCLLKRGAAAVAAVDVGYGELDYRLRTDPRVSVLERTNARALTPQMLPFVPDLATIDVSFVSLAKVLPAVVGCLAARHDVMAMVKPQFEVGRERVGKGGVVRCAEDRRAALVSVALAAVEVGEAVIGMYPSGLPGPKGNLETFLWLAEGERRGSSVERAQLERLALEAEPG